MSRELRSLVPFEVAGVIAIAVIPLPELLPVALPLLVAASLSRWIRQRSWAELTSGDGRLARAAIGIGAGAVALAVSIGLVREGPSLSPIPIAGDLATGAKVMLYVAVMAIAAELALRGWIVERAIELARGIPVLPIAVGALAEAMVTPGDVTVRIGAAIFGAGFGWLYVASGRNLVAPVFARMTFFVGAVAIEGFELL